MSIEYVTILFCEPTAPTPRHPCEGGRSLATGRGEEARLCARKPYPGETVHVQLWQDPAQPLHVQELLQCESDVL